MTDKREYDGLDISKKSSKKSRLSSSVIAIPRSISACQRCRSKKVRCDQTFPKCLKCAKAGVDCIGLDPATGREIPRSYVVHLEDKISELEDILKKHGIDALPGAESKTMVPSNSESTTMSTSNSNLNSNPIPQNQNQNQNQNPNAILNLIIKSEESPGLPKIDGSTGALAPPANEDMSNLMEGVTDVTMLAGSRAPPGYLDNNSDGISFAKLMFTAVKVNKKTSRNSPAPSAKPINNNESNNGNGTSNGSANGHGSTATTGVPIDPSVFLKHEVLPAILPPKSTAQGFIKIFFAQSNSQLPILHREEFIKNCFIPIYGSLDLGISLASNYTAINTSIIEGEPYNSENSNDPSANSSADPSSSSATTECWFTEYKNQFSKYMQEHSGEKIDPVKISNSIIPPAKYNKALYFLNIVFAIASSVHHLQYPSTISDSFKAAAVKYIEPVYSLHDQLESLQGILLLALYSIMRPAVPGVWYVLGLALRVVVDLGLHKETANSDRDFDLFTKDKRRRLFWCTYSLDRQICFYLGRPVGIPEECIQVPFPSELDDALIIPNDGSISDYLTLVSGMPTYKVVSLSFFKIRQIQTEVQRFLCYENLELPRQYNTYQEWEIDISERLQLWKSQAPKTQRKMNCDFNLVFFTLNYNHTIIMLHGISRKKFSLLINDFYKVSEASKELINCYHQLFFSKSINYTWAAVHNLFMAGSLYLYTIYNSPQVRERNSFYEVKKVTQECITILNSLIDRCDAASSCKEIFEVLTAAILKIRYQETVQGISGVVPSTQQIARLQPAGHVNSNLEQLVESLNSPQNSPSHQSPKLAHTTPVTLPPPSTNFHLNPFEMTPPDSSMFKSHRSSPQMGQSPSNGTFPATDNNFGETFEWITDSGALPDLYGQQKTHQYDLDIFFDELENLSSASSNVNQSRRPSLEPIIENVGNEPDEVYLTLNISSTPYPSLIEKLRQPSSSSAGRSGSTSDGFDGPGAPTKEAKRIYELIHQMPTESIWDQFFTTNTVFNNASLP